MTDPAAADQTIGFGYYLRFRYCNLEFICYLVLIICYFRFVRVRVSITFVKQPLPIFRIFQSLPDVNIEKIGNRLQDFG